MISIHSLFDEAAEQYEQKIAIEDNENFYTYGQLKEASEKIANALISIGVQKKECVAILAPNCFSYMALQYATSRIGAVLEVINTRHVANEIIYALNNANAKVIFVHEDFQAHLKALHDASSIECSVGIGKVNGCNLHLDDLLSKDYESNLPVNSNKNEAAVLMYTSGTTGRPKGAVQSQENSYCADLITKDLLGLNKEDRFFAFMPFFHQAGLIRARAVLSQGGTIVIEKNLSKNNLATIIKEKEITITMLVPPYSGALINACNENNIKFTKLRLLIGGPPSKGVREFCEKNECIYTSVYGQTEVTGLITSISGEDFWIYPGSVGKPVSDMNMEIWDEEGRSVGPGCIGEIMAKSPRCIHNYWNNEEATKLLYTREWLHTGDLGIVDEEGYLYFIGRKKELIKTGGENVYPLEVEQVLIKHPNIQDLAVMGIPDSEWGEKVICFLVSKDGSNISNTEIKQFCQDQLSGYKIPKEVYCIEEIPRNHTGKIDKLFLKELIN